MFKARNAYLHKSLFHNVNRTVDPDPFKLNMSSDKSVSNLYDKSVFYLKFVRIVDLI